MKKGLGFLIGIISVIFIPSVYAKEINTITITSTIVKNQIIYGENYILDSSTMDSSDYDVTMKMCNESGSICNNEDSNPYTRLSAGNYKIGYSVTLKDGNTFGSNTSWIINGESINPSECGQTSANNLGCDYFYNVEIRDVTYIDVYLNDVKFDYKVGDQPNDSLTLSDRDSLIYGAVIGWYKDIDGTIPVTGKFERKKYYLIVEIASRDAKYGFNWGKINFYINGEKRNILTIKDDATGEDIPAIRGDETGGAAPVFVLDLTKVDVKPDIENVENNNIATAASEVINDAISAIENGEDVIGISQEVIGKIKDALDNGKEITTEVVTTSIKNEDLSEELKRKIEAKKESSQNILGYFDIMINIKADDEVLGNITKFNNNITITLDANELIGNLPKVENGKTRVFKIIRVHDGEVDVLDAILNDDNTLSFQTDRFSDYIVMYNDVDTINNPKTGDNIMFYISMLGLSIIGLAGAVIYTKKKRFN